MVVEYKHKNGQLRIRNNYLNGIPHGLWECWYDNGQLRYQYNYVRRIITGIAKSFYPDGKPKKTKFYLV